MGWSFTLVSFTMLILLHEADAEECHEEEAFGEAVPSSKRQVPLVDWSEHTEQDTLLSELAQFRTPFVVKGFRGLGKCMSWTPQYITEKLSVIPDVYIGEHAEFLYHDEDRAFAKLTHVEWHNPFRKRDMHADAFFAAAADEESQKEFVYFSGAVDKLGVLAEDVEKSSPLVVQEGVERQRVDIHAWIGMKGVVAHTHYDTSHNAYVQVHGRKRWTLWPPHAAQALHIYPLLHPATRQSQLEFDNITNVPHYETVLEEGDMLYLPPYWLHRVEALTLSISVNVWSDSKEWAATMAVYNSELPFEADWDPMTMRRAIRAYTCLVVNEVVDDVDSFFDDLLQTRYHGVFGSMLSSQFTSECARPIESSWGNFKPFAVDAAKHLDRDGPGVLQLMDYVEVIPGTLLDAKDVPLFLQACFVDVRC